MNYLKVTKLDDALNSLKTIGNFKVLAGGTDLLVEHNRQPLAMDTTFVYIGDIDEFKLIRNTGTTLEIGSLVTAAQLAQSDLVALKAAALQKAAKESASPQVRNRATIGGNIATASPAGDLVCALYALDASVLIVGPKGRRLQNITELITGVKKIALQPDELIAGVNIPLMSENTGSAFCKMGKRQAMTISLASAACMVIMENGIIHDIRLVAGAVAPMVLRMTTVEQALLGKHVDENFVREKCELAKVLISPITDQRATAWYRSEVIPVLLYQAVMQATANAATRRYSHD